MVQVVFLIVVGIRGFDSETLHRFHAQIHLGDDTAGLVGELVFEEPVASIWICIGHILFLWVLYAAISAGLLVVEIHAGHGIEATVAEYHITSVGCVVGACVA